MFGTISDEWIDRGVTPSSSIGMSKSYEIDLSFEVIRAKHLLQTNDISEEAKHVEP